MQIRVSDTKIGEALRSCGLERKHISLYPHEAQDSEKSVHLTRMPKNFLLALAKLFSETDKNRKIIENFLTPPDQILEKKVSSLTEVAALLASVEGRGDVVASSVGKLTFPVTLESISFNDSNWGTYCVIYFGFKYGDHSGAGKRVLGPDIVKDNPTLREVLMKGGFKPLSQEGYKLHTDQVAKTYKLQNEMENKVVRIKGPVYVPPFFGSSPIEISIGKGEKKAIVESELERRDEMWYNNTEDSDEVIPLVRVFLLDRKVYCYVHVDNITEHTYDKTGFSKVVMPEGVRTLFERIFSAGTDRNFGDIFGGRHGGTVILADGPPGVGKTLTAEAVAELSERPLYVADVGEIGIDLDTVEEKLKLVLDRASKWNAVLLLDEADIFLVKRDVDNIERNAIVGTFLKFLDGFDGTLFLTTNRVHVIDPAFASRITARIEYKPLDSKARFQIWKRMVEVAKIKLPEPVMKHLSEEKMNGRQIRNLVRLTKMYHGDKDLTFDDISMLQEHVLKVKETWEAPEGAEVSE